MAYGAHTPGAEVPALGAMGTRQCAIDPLIRKMPSKAQQLRFVSAAGPGGSWLSRSLTNKGSEGWGVAPSLMPTKAGERVQTNRRDAGPLARLARSGALPAVSVPTVDEAALRARTRARDEARSALNDAQCRRKACVRRHDRRDTGRAPGPAAPLRWRSEVGCPTPAQPIVLPEAGRAGPAHTERLQRLAQARQAQGQAWRRHPVVDALQALRGVQCTVAVPPGAERGDRTRFETPRARMQLLGRMPSAYATGERRRPGAMTKAGQTQARRARVAGAWAERSPAQVRRQLQRRRAKHPKAIPALRWQAQGRLCQRYRTLSARGPHANQGGVALARELLGVMWAMAHEMPVTPSDHKTEHHQPVTQTVAGVPRQRRRPGVVYPSTACRAPEGILGPRVRQAPDGGKEGGSQPTDSSRITRRILLAPTLLRHKG